ncbi:MAG: ABC transporter permease [Desulfuromonas sp.]|nr:MAG: ABC transporter permease [Desulfuromonas sp.]
MLRKTFYFLLRAVRNMWQSPMLTSASIVTVTVALAVLAFFAVLVQNISDVTRHWSEEVQVVVYLASKPDAAERNADIQKLRADPAVVSVAYISPEQARNSFRQRLGADEDLIKGMPSDFLPASYELHLSEEMRSETGVKQLVERLRQQPRYRDLRYGQEWLERYGAIISLLRVGGFIMGGFLLFAALFIVANTIRLTLYARREELEVMTLVGATPWFVRAPFLLEGGLQGFVGGLFALLVTFGLYHLALRSQLATLFMASGVGQIHFLPAAYQVYLLLTGTFLGLFGSLVSLRRFVRISP